MSRALIEGTGTRRVSPAVEDTSLVRDDRSNEWMAGHLHFSGNPNPMLYRFVGPFLRRMKEEGHLESYFFIRYWTEGQHIRVRMLPTRGADREWIRETFRAEAEEFFRRRPFLLPAMQLDDPETIKRTFLAEYPESAWNELYGSDGAMPLRAPNQLLWTRYSPEFGRYGGVHGMNLSESHFKASSDLVFTLLETSNLHIRGITLGAAAQIMTSMTVAMLGSVEASLQYLDSYEERWRHGWGGLYAPRAASFEAAYSAQAEMIVPRIRSVVENTWRAVQDPDGPSRSYLDHWARQCRSTRGDIDRMAAAGQLVFPRTRDSEVWDLQPDPEIATRGLAFSYVHMMNNRLGVPIVDEIYLAYLLRRALEDSGLTEVTVGDLS